MMQLWASLLSPPGGEESEQLLGTFRVEAFYEHVVVDYEYGQIYDFQPSSGSSSGKLKYQVSHDSEESVAGAAAYVYECVQQDY